MIVAVMTHMEANVQSIFFLIIGATLALPAALVPCLAPIGAQKISRLLDPTIFSRPARINVRVPRFPRKQLT